MPERHLTPKQAYQAVALFLEEYRQSLAEATDAEPEWADSGSPEWDDTPAARLPYSHSFGDLAVSVTLLRNGTPVDPYLWDSWRACLPPGGITARRAYTATERFLDGYYGATGCVEAATLRRYMALPSETEDTPALWDRWTACIASVLSTPHPPRRRSDPPDDPTSW
jgi:hypothetical protein